MNYRIDPRGPKGVADLAVMLAKAATGDVFTVLLPKDLHPTVGQKLIDMLGTQSNQRGIALTFELEAIDQ